MSYGDPVMGKWKVTDWDRSRETPPGTLVVPLANTEQSLVLEYTGKGQRPMPTDQPEFDDERWMDTAVRMAHASANAGVVIDWKAMHAGEWVAVPFNRQLLYNEGTRLGMSINLRHNGVSTEARFAPRTASWAPETDGEWRPLGDVTRQRAARLARDLGLYLHAKQIDGVLHYRTSTKPYAGEKTEAARELAERLLASTEPGTYPHWFSRAQMDFGDVSNSGLKNALHKILFDRGYRPVGQFTNDQGTFKLSIAGGMVGLQYGKPWEHRG